MTAITREERWDALGERLTKIAEANRKALLLAWTSPKNTHIEDMTETQRLAEIDRLLHGTISDLGSAINHYQRLDKEEKS